MANLTRVFSLFVTATALLTACGMTLPKQTPAATVATQAAGMGPVEGRFSPVNGAEVDLASTANQIQVIMFVSDTCSVCRAETRSLIQDRGLRGAPNNAVFYSIIVGALREDAFYWQTTLDVPWLVGTDKGDPLFRRLCAPELLTPCILLHNPRTGVNTKVIGGSHSIQDLERITGPWYQ